MPNRLFYAVQQIGFRDTEGAYAYDDVAHGVQSIGMTANFNLQPLFEYGQLELYENIEEIPNVELTASKVLDGYPLLYHHATKSSDTTAPTLSGRGNSRTLVGMSVFDDTSTSATGTPNTIMECSGMYVSTVGYNFPLDDNFNEDITLVGYDRIWQGDTDIVHPVSSARAAALSFPGQFDNNDEPLATYGVNRRQDIIFGTSASGVDSDTGALDDPNISVLPQDIPGITASGTNELTDGEYGAHIAGITVSADFGREAINELGRLAPYHRFLNFPVEVTAEIRVTTTSGDIVSMTEAGIRSTSDAACSYGGNLTNRSIRLATCEGTRIYLGKKNKLASINYGGGDVGGGNVETSFAYSNYNDLTVVHSGDPHPSGSTWWTDRVSYMIG